MSFVTNIFSNLHHLIYAIQSFHIMSAFIEEKKKERNTKYDKLLLLEKYQIKSTIAGAREQKRI